MDGARVSHPQQPEFPGEYSKFIDGWVLSNVLRLRQPRSDIGHTLLMHFPRIR
jgi:hypothetical protein